jgi:hypothetical protein
MNVIHVRPLKGSLVHVVSACVGSRKGSDNVSSYVHNLKPMTSWSKCNNSSIVPGPLPKWVNVAFTCVGSKKWSNHFEFYVRKLSLDFCKRLFSGPHDLNQ